MNRAIGRQGQSRQWLRDARTAAYREYIKQCSTLEIELREAYLATCERRPTLALPIAAPLAILLGGPPAPDEMGADLVRVPRCWKEFASRVDHHYGSRRDDG